MFQSAGMVFVTQTKTPLLAPLTVIHPVRHFVMVCLFYLVLRCRQSSGLHFLFGLNRLQVHHYAEATD